MTLTPVKASALHTSRQAWCASGVAAAEANAGVWFPPFGSVGMAIMWPAFSSILELDETTYKIRDGWMVVLPEAKHLR